MAAKLNIRAREAPAVVAVGLLLATCLFLAATVASASRPLKVSSSSSEGEGDGAQAHHTVESPTVGYIIQTVVVGTADAEQDGGAAGGGQRWMNVDMVAGIKNTGPSPGDGH